MEYVVIPYLRTEPRQTACHYSGVKDLTIRTLEQTKASLDNPALLFSCLESSDSIIVLLQRKKIDNIKVSASS